MKGAANVSLSLGKLGSVRIPIPPLKEQLKLIDNLIKCEMKLEEAQAQVHQLREAKAKALLRFKAEFSS